ncbi:type II toxin-antitoxin system VapC family toxin [Thermococcus sp.]|uniref:type II toxin-antitoxin system VapC family toxin n=1 Tax=Thermococcus sp. TaxID=35749 RepID=UPI0026209190|nr:type II toxin-antitoxin system VapC family toxin [Thermococcus sp.]
MKLFLDTNLLIYLALGSSDPSYESAIDDFYSKLVEENELYTDVLVLDEFIHVLRRKYGVPYERSINFVDETILPVVKVLPLTFFDYLMAREIITRCNLKPSDAFHIAVIQNNGFQAIVSEDEDFDRLPLKRLWLEG